MTLPTDPFSAILGIGGKIIDKLFPDPQQKAEAQAKLIALHQQGELEQARIYLSAILAEAQSQDPWTSRARPTFLYVMYAMILFGIPMGVVSVFSPEAATQIANGMKAWLAALPGELYALFGAGYLGYAVFRSRDKESITKLLTDGRK